MAIVKGNATCNTLNGVGVENDIIYGLGGNDVIMLLMAVRGTTLSTEKLPFSKENITSSVLREPGLRLKRMRYPSEETWSLSIVPPKING